MKTWYCVNIEFYDNRNVKACITSRQANEKPKNQYRVVHGLSAYKIWFSNESITNQLLSDIKDGSADHEDISWLFIEMAVAA